jgi:hypothetical protein
MLYCHGPKLGIGNVVPVNRSMQHHRPGNTHDCLNPSFSNSVVVMGTDACKPLDLLELFHLGLVLL